MSEQINKLIHTKVLGLCGHSEMDSGYIGQSISEVCETCRCDWDEAIIPDYCTDRNAAFEAVMKCVEDDYAEELGRILWKLPRVHFNTTTAINILLVSPEQQCLAVLDCYGVEYEK